MAGSDKKTLNDRANPSQLGDPVSLKAETSNTQPTEHGKPNKASEKQSLKEKAEQELQKDKAGGRSQLGDPVSLKAETSNTEPTADDRGALGTNKTGKPKM